MTTGVHASDDTDGFKPKATYCLKCAGRLEDRIIEDKARRACAACDFVFYQDPKPVAGVLAVRDGNLLLIQRGNEPKRGLWSFPTGYIDVGDSPEETGNPGGKGRGKTLRYDSIAYSGCISDKQRHSRSCHLYRHYCFGEPRGWCRGIRRTII